MLADSIAQEVALRDPRVVRSVAKVAVDDYAQRGTRARRSECVRWPTWRNPSTGMETKQATLLISSAACIKRHCSGELGGYSEVSESRRPSLMKMTV